MLTNLSIKNYALIDQLNVSFTKGFTVITGETGAGKSILLGGLSLVLGKRADLSSLRDKTLKCVIEAEFNIEKYNLNSFFTKQDLDYESTTIIRREIQPSGKSRAFVNDTPVTLDILSKLGERLIDVHSQHQTLQLGDTNFQLKVVDALAGNSKILIKYSSALNEYQSLVKELEELIIFRDNASKEQDYNSFLLKELESAPLKEGILEELEEEYEQLNNVELIMEQLATGNQLLNEEQIGVIGALSQLKQVTTKLSGFSSKYNSLNERVQSVFIELDDIATELQDFIENTEANPKVLEEVNAKLQLLYDLQKKHSVLTIEELVAVREDLSKKVSTTENIEATIKEKEEALSKQKNVLEEIVISLRNRRQKIIPNLKKQLESSLSILGMPSASFKIEVVPSEKYKTSGKDDLIFLFSANKGGNYGELKKVASGGELSRIMLVIKAILAKYEDLPTIMFDEIDTGVSGEISGQMGVIMKNMSADMQVFSITHLPQVASKGNQHYKVHKTENTQGTTTNLYMLSKEERVVELAEMLGGKEHSDSAIAHAKELLSGV
ncbi:DNA replication and repair protein RecN [Maribacter vaceletii]|uniref:DNA repair protein RecN n=1 Tax=Maribacter vaceletii TaxID=1206816 RepID=A0A495E9A5_9FLAO|nr:DNA repair protein RecN [Maribacter vaceletii]RKR13386.1 DNA replication and repair protein RecN [Maribacter vaceletii]